MFSVALRWRWLCTDDISGGNISIYQGCHACIFIVDPRNVDGWWGS